MMTLYTTWPKVSLLSISFPQILEAGCSDSATAASVRSVAAVGVLLLDEARPCNMVSELIPKVFEGVHTPDLSYLPSHRHLFSSLPFRLRLSCVFSFSHHQGAPCICAEQCQHQRQRYSEDDSAALSGSARPQGGGRAPAEVRRRRPLPQQVRQHALQHRHGYQQH